MDLRQVLRVQMFEGIIGSVNGEIVGSEPTTLFRQTLAMTHQTYAGEER
jgi:hypothetical protein